MYVCIGYVRCVVHSLPVGMRRNVVISIKAKRIGAILSCCLDSVYGVSIQFINHINDCNNRIARGRHCLIFTP